MIAQLQDRLKKKRDKEEAAEAATGINAIAKEEAAEGNIEREKAATRIGKIARGNNTRSKNTRGKISIWQGGGHPSTDYDSDEPPPLE